MLCSRPHKFTTGGCACNNKLNVCHPFAKGDVTPTIVIVAELRDISYIRHYSLALAPIFYLSRCVVNSKFPAGYTQKNSTHRLSKLFSGNAASITERTQQDATDQQYRLAKSIPLYALHLRATKCTKLGDSAVCRCHHLFDNHGTQARIRTRLSPL